MAENHQVEDRALKAAGYARLPRLWVPKDVLLEIIEEAELYGAEVKRIRRQARNGSAEKRREAVGAANAQIPQQDALDRKRPCVTHLRGSESVVSGYLNAGCRYGRASFANVRAAFNDLRAGVRAGDFDAAEAALDRYEPWADAVFDRNFTGGNTMDGLTEHELRADIEAEVARMTREALDGATDSERGRCLDAVNYVWDQHSDGGVVDEVCGAIHDAISAKQSEDEHDGMTRPGDTCHDC